MYIAKLLINVFDAVETIMTSCKLVSKQQANKASIRRQSNAIKQ